MEGSTQILATAKCVTIVFMTTVTVNRNVQSQVRFTSSLEVNDEHSKFMSAKYSIDNVR